MNERAIRLTILGFASLMLVAIVWSVRISAVQPPYGTQVFGSGHVWRGHTAVFRIQLMDPDGYTALVADALTLGLRDSRGTRLHRMATPTELTTVGLDVPADLEAYSWLDVDVQRAEGRDHVSITLRADDTPTASVRLAPWRESLDPRLPAPRPTPWMVAAYPAGGKLVGGLDNRVYLRATMNDAPFAGTLSCDATRLDAPVDAAGVVSFLYRPAAHGAPLHVLFDHDPNRAVDLPMEVRPAQLALGVAGGPRIEAGAQPGFGVTTLPFNDTVYVDMWVGNAWVASTQGLPVRGVFGDALGVPADARGLVRWSAYRSFDRPEDTVAHAWKWVDAPFGSTANGTGANETPAWTSQAARALSELRGGDVVLDALAKTNREDAARSLLTLALTRLVPDEAGPPRLANTADARRMRFENAKAAERGRIHGFFAGVMGIGLSLASLLLWRHHARTRAAVGAALDGAEEEGIQLDPGARFRMNNWQQLYALVLALVTLAMAGYGLFVLLGRMRWDR